MGRRHQRRLFSTIDSIITLLTTWRDMDDDDIVSICHQAPILLPPLHQDSPQVLLAYIPPDFKTTATIVDRDAVMRTRPMRSAAIWRGSATQIWKWNGASSHLNLQMTFETVKSPQIIVDSYGDLLSQSRLPRTLQAYSVGQKRSHNDLVIREVKFIPLRDTLVAYSDADWRVVPLLVDQTSGYCVFLSGNNLSPGHRSAKFTLSTVSAEAEYGVLAKAVAETCWITSSIT
ncbi:hypothetical protein Tco_0152776 [Tanacetum coccineum]